jgi:hypothetical protein
MGTGSDKRQRTRRTRQQLAEARAEEERKTARERINAGRFFGGGAADNDPPQNPTPPPPPPTDSPPPSPPPAPPPQPPVLQQPLSPVEQLSEIQRTIKSVSLQNVPPCFHDRVRGQMFTVRQWFTLKGNQHG